MKPLPVKPGELKHILANLMRETGRSRDECADAYERAGHNFNRAIGIIRAEIVIPDDPPPAPPRPVKAQQVKHPAPPKFIPLPSAFPHPIPPVKVELPGDGSPQAIRAYWQEWESDYARRCADRAEAKRQAELHTQQRAREVCGRVAEMVADKS